MVRVPIELVDPLKAGAVVDDDGLVEKAADEERGVGVHAVHAVAASADVFVMVCYFWRRVLRRGIDIVHMMFKRGDQ